MTNWSRWPNFSQDEMACRCGCRRAGMDPDFMDALQRLRTFLDFPLKITSGFRCPAHNRAVGGGPAHPAGKAVDINVWGPKAFDVIAHAHTVGMLGVGIKQMGAYQQRFVHLDNYDGPEAPRPWVWSYES